ncbi:F-box/WD repeat-containing protein 15-like isoform X3 [Mus caroli]|uniref:F-box/WD repeat-containing protein 15-like isoform X3 n=1 Tax=Mus caroli TaxID=10089 RepID=A0A6P5QDJ8_MUSCR|nr:F-box/WD repeat-containing protein 15-like isoform X3 [Mus caroli]
METNLPSLPMMEIFSYLDAYSLLQVAQVNKNWNELASSDVLWRKLCQKRWFFCDMVTLQLHGKETWKQFFIYRTWQEHAKTRAKPEDFTYKEIPVEFEFRAYAYYISKHGLTRNGQGKSAVCMVTSMNRISTWDIHEGVMTWESPVQEFYIELMTTLPEMHIVVTVDIRSTIKLWDCHNSEALATKRMVSSCQLLKAVITKDGPIVLVFYMNSLLRPSEFSDPVSTILEFSLCKRAFWTPRREDRITLMSRNIPPSPTKFGIFDMKLEEIGNKVTVQGHLTASFSLADYEGTPECFGVSDKDVFVCSTGSSLLLFNINGLCLQTFQYCPEMIVRLCVDPVHVIVICNNGSLDVYAWEERSPLLRKCYRLQNRSYLPPSSFINKALCDDVSIIGVMTNSPAPCYLMAYTLNICS